MARSFFTATRDSALAAGSANFSAGISAAPLSLGLSVAQAAAYAAADAAFQGAYQTSITPATRTKSSVAAKNALRIPLRQMASDLAKIIDGTVTDAQKVNLGISVRATPAPRPAPGTPDQFKVSLAADGALTLTWKCDNPRGSSGTIYQVWRRIALLGTTGDFTYLGAAGSKQFVDHTLPSGATQVTYQIQAIRSKAIGAPAQYNVNFGTTPAEPLTAEAPTETSNAPAAMRRAA